MSDLVKFWIGAEFVIPRVRLTGPELAYGYRKGWIDAADVVKIAVSNLESGGQSPVETRLAMLLFDELDDVWRLLEHIEPAGDGEDVSRVWLYLCLAWLLEHEAQYEDPLGVIEMIHADFGHPEEINALVRYMRADPGETPGAEGLRERWRAYIDDRTAEYARRRSLEQR